MTDKPSSIDWRFDSLFDEAAQAALLRFGHFITAYAQVEGWCHVMFRRHCGLKENVARSITGGMRLADLLPILSTVIAASSISDEDKNDFTVCIEQLNHLTSFRHRLVHRGFQKSTGIIDGAMGRFISSNEVTVKAREGIELLRFELDDIKNAAWDCVRIHARMQFLGIKLPDGQNVRSLLADDFREETYGPWLYKPVQPEKPNHPPRKGHQ